MGAVRGQSFPGDTGMADLAQVEALSAGGAARIQR